MPERITISTEPSGTCFAEEPSTASDVILSSVSPMTATFMSFGETHGTVPFDQKAAFAFDGVPPPIHVPSLPRGSHVHPTGSGQGPSEGSSSGLTASGT